MAIAFLLLCGGIALLLIGGYVLVRGASDLARAAGVPALAIGLTVVAFGTSTPELAVNFAGVFSGRSEVAFGNVVGSNLANIGLILGFAALVRPLTIRSEVIVGEIPVMLLATIAVAVVALDGVLRGEPGVLDRSDGFVLLVFFAAFLYRILRTLGSRPAPDPLIEQSIEVARERPGIGAATAAVLVVGGLIALVVGGSLAVDNAALLGSYIGLPPWLIAFSVIAVGTSLPELVTASLAARAGEFDLAVGSVVGSNVFNLLFIMGVTASARPVIVPPGGVADLLVLLLGSLLLLPLAITHQRKIVRAEGVVLLGLWLAYTAWRVISSV